MMTLRTNIIIFFSIISLPFAQAQDDALKPQHVQKYQDCLSLVENDNAAGLAEARKWYLAGGGVAAQHCEALALYEQDRFSEAATLFDNVIGKLSRDESVNEFAIGNKKNLMMQLNYLAGIAWHSAGDLDRAYNALSASIVEIRTGAPYGYDVFIERGLVLVSTEKYQSAVEDFQRALEINDEKVDAYLFRAETYRKMNEHLKARLDINVALSLEPNHPDVLFESGVNYRMQHNDEKALVEWEKLIREYPNSYWQELAEKNIELIGQ